MNVQDDAQAAVAAAEKVRDDLAANPAPTPTPTGIEFVEIHYVDGTVTHLVPEGSGEPTPTDGGGSDASPVGNSPEPEAPPEHETPGTQTEAA